MAETVRIEIPIEVIDEMEPELSNVQKKLSKFEKSAEKTQRSLSKWAKEKYEVLLEAKERITPVLRTIGSGIRNFTGKTWRVTMKAVDLVTAPVRGILNVLKNPVFQVGAVLGVSVGMKDTIDTYKDFEAAMSQVSAVSGATGSDLDKLTEKAKVMGANTKFTATEAAEGFNYMAMAGWKTSDMLDGIEGIMSLAAASGEDLATTSDIVTDALTAFNLQASDSGHFADVLAAASSNANTNVSMLGESFKYVAPVAGAMKYSVEDVSLALGLMANASVKSSMAGTSLKTAIANLAAPTDKMQAAMKKYNISLTDSKGKAKDFKAVIDNARSSLGKLSETEQTAAIKTIFGKEAMAGMAAIVNASEKDYNKLAKAVNNADGASAKMEKTMMDNLQGSITYFQSAFDGVKMSLGKRLTPYVRSAADWLTESMPAVQEALESLMDGVDRKVDRLKAKFKEISLGDDWQNADFFGKAKIMWDEFIANPFADWWKNTGKAKIASTMGDLGGMIGSGLHTGIMALLGFDVSDSLDEGASIGKSFAKGFADGFDFNEISKKLWEGLGNVVKNAGKLLPGGESADLSSVMSVALLAKIAGPFFKLGSGGIKLGKALFGSGGTTGGGSLIGTLLGSASGGSGILGFGANTAINLGAGNLAGGASLGTGALSGIGLGATAGGVAAGATLISSGMDYYKASKADTKEEKDMYTESANWKMGGVVAGTAAGAAIGSVVPVLGTAVGALIGAGVGGIAGWIKGNKVKEEYEENLEEAQKAAEKAKKVYSATGRDIKDVWFKTLELNDAIEDTEVTAEEFSQMFQEAVVKNMEDHFGDISLSLKEVQEVASQIVFDDQTESINNFTEAVQNSDNSMSALQRSVSDLKKANWKIGLNTKLSKDDKEQYREAIDSFAKSAVIYIENQHYEATVALELLIGESNKGMTNGLDSMYSKLQKKAEKYSNELDVTVKAAMKDGIIDIDEQEEISKAQEKITKITSKLSRAKEEASFSSMKIKYSGAALSSDSFASMQEELQKNVASMTETYDSSLNVSLANLQLQLDEGAIDQKTYDELYQKIADGYNENIKALQDRVQDFQLDSIADAYKSELQNILPDIEGDTSERLKVAMNKALAIEPDAVKWTEEQVSKWFGLENLDGETQGALFERLKMTAESIPDSVAAALHKNYKENVQQNFEQILADSSFNEQFMNAGTKYGNYLTAGASSSILSGSSELRTSAQTSLSTAFADPFSVTANVSVTPNYKVNGSFTVPEFPSILESDSDGKGNTSFKANKNGGNGGGGATAWATGGYASYKQLSWLAEEGYGEWIIPTNPSRRGRALELYEQAGRSLGVDRHAEGGFVSPNGRSYPKVTDNYNDDFEGMYSDQEQEYFSGNSESGSVGDTNIEINVEMNPEFTISGTEGQNPDNVLEVIRQHISEIADEIGGEIAVQIEAAFSNRPLKEA